MPWPFFIPEFLKRRACRYLLHYYLGQFLEEKLSLEDLTIDLYNGTGSVSNVPLNVETINEVLEEASAPVEVVEGYIGCISISVPWSSLMSSSCKVEISGLNIAITPSYTHYNGNVSMTDSLFFNMSRSRQLAEEVLKAPPTSNEQDKEELEMSGFEGMEILAKAIEAILLRIQVSLVDTTVNICQHSPRNGMDSISSHKHELGLHISRVEFFDELTQMEDGKEDGSGTMEEEVRLPEVGEFATKVLRLSGLTLELSDATNNSENKEDDNDNSCSVPIACASGEVDVKVKIKQSDTVPGPKLDIQVLLESIHMLLYPQQLHTLLELVNGITSKYNKLNSTLAEQTHETAQTSSHYPGLSRPIPKRDMRTIENQLVNHMDIQRKKKMAEEELLQLDPWNIAAREMKNRDGHMSESAHSSTSDMFYSFDLQQNPDDSISSQSIKGEAPRINDTHMQDGVGLEQVPSPKFRASHLSVVEEQCVYAITIGGVTCAILENKPVHTHIVRSAGRRSSNDGDDCSETDSYSSARADSYFRTDAESHSLGSTSELCSLDEGGLDPFKYLDCVRDVLRGRVGPREIKSCENKLGQILPADHIFLWMSTINAKIATEGVSTSVSLTVVSAELQEYLYHNEASLPLITPVSIQSLIQFLDDPLNHHPCLSLQVSSKSMPSPSAKLKSSKLKCPPSTPHTDVELSLARLHFYLDVTIIDRLHTLLHPQPLYNSASNVSLTRSTYGVGNTLCYPSVNAGAHGNQKKFVSQVLFSEAMSPSSGSNSTLKVSIKVAVKTVDASVRFPVADLSESVRPPWYRPPLRTEVLFLEFLDLSLFTSFVAPVSTMKSITGSTSFEAAKVYFSLDGSYENRQLFAVFESYSDPNYPKSKQLDMPSIKLTYQVLEESPLDRPSSRGNGMGTGIGMGLRIDESDDDDDEYGIDGSTSIEPSPFSQRNEKILFSPDKGNRSSTETGSRQIILPASPDEMHQYQTHLSSTSNFSLSVSIPSVSIHIPNKVFLETLFNRISMDLLLWQPGSPADMEKAAARSVFYSSADILQPAMTKEDKFKLCKSVLRESSREEDCTDSFTFSSLLSPTHSDPPKAPTLMMTSLTIDRGTVSLVLPIKTVGVSSSANAPPTTGSRSSPGPHLLDLSPRRLPNSSSIEDPSEKGLVVIKTRGCHVCAGINYEGEPERTQICCQLDEINISHCGCLPHSSSLLVDPESLLLDIDAIPLKDFLIPWNYMSDSDVSGRGLNRGRDPVLSLSMDSRTEKDTNRRVHKVAIQLSGVLLNYTPCLTQHTLFHQCGEFFRLDTMTVPGYDPPTVITELYIDLKQSGLQYRPLHLPSHGVLTFEDLSLSTTLVTDSPLLVIDLLIDQMRLFVSNKQQKLNDINLRRDFVCVVELLIFQVALRLCNKADMSPEASKLFSHIPEVDLQCSGSELHLMFCVDSCSIFRDLIIYLAENGDLKNRKHSDVTPPLLTVDTPMQEEEEAESKSATKPHPPPVMVSSTIGDLISEAMDDNEGQDRLMTTSTTSSYTSTSTRGSHGGTPAPISPTAVTSPARSTINERHAHSRITTNTMTFSSDSEPDMNITPTATGRIKQQIELAMADEDWEIDEDDYCVLAPPTTTKVGPSAEPGVKCLLNEEDGETPFALVDNYYQVPDVQIDQLKRPKHFPNPVTSYSLRELTIVWHLYGGWDFAVQAPPPHPSTPSISSDSSLPVLKKHKVLASTGASEDQVAFHKRTGGSQYTWIRKGGNNRDHDVMMEFELDKLRLQYESYPEGVEQFSRIVLLIRDLEIRDRLAVSRINKFLYHYSTETRPRQNHANMVTFKVLFTHPDSRSQPVSVDSFQSLEATVRVSMLPLRLNIDQDSFFFLYEFFNNLLPQSNTPDNLPPPTTNGSAFPSTDTSTETVSHYETPPTSCNTSSSRDGDVFIKSFVFYPDVTIRVDYEAKRFQSKQLSALTGMLLGLSHLDNSEVTLKALTYKNGVLGWNQLFEQVMSEWVQDIQRYQLPRILQGVGPVYHVTQLFQGALNLFWMPVQQYQEDGRILWGIQRGANSFVSSSGVAVVELSNRMLQSVESLAQTAFDIVNTKERRQLIANQAQDTPITHQPADLREGIANAYNVVSTGIGSTAWDLYDAASTEHNEYGVTGAVGGVLKNIPGTIVRPIIFMSEATRHVLGGMKNQFVPEARKEATDKWKSS